MSELQKSLRGSAPGIVSGNLADSNKKRLAEAKPPLNALRE